jgi:hypothetical protein
MQLGSQREYSRQLSLTRKNWWSSKSLADGIVFFAPYILFRDLKGLFFHFVRERHEGPAIGVPRSEGPNSLDIAAGRHSVLDDRQPARLRIAQTCESAVKSPPDGPPPWPAKSVT